MQLASPQAQAGATIELQGVLLNDTGNLLSTPPIRKFEGRWVDVAGQSRPAHFTLSTSADAITLPANAYTRMAWTGQVPADAQGLLTLQLNGVDHTLLAVQVSRQPAAQSLAAIQGPAHESTPAHARDAVAPAHTGAANGLSPFETFRNALSPYEPLYFALGNRGGANARFQLSFKYRPFSPANPSKPGFMNDWYLGYTQTSLWDLDSDSIPFVDTTYNPSVFWAREVLWQSSGQRLYLGLNSGIEHKSNGKDGDDSRSLNDLYIQPAFNLRLDSGSTLSFMPRFKYYVWTDEEMHYPDSLGHIDWKLRWAQDNGLGLTALYRQGSGSRSATQLEVTWPLKRTFLSMNGHLYVQYFRGYGETLLDYNRKLDPQLRIGIALVP